MLCQMSDLLPEDFSGDVNPAGLRVVRKGFDGNVVRDVGEKLTASIEQIKLRLKPRSVEPRQNVEQLPLTAAASKRADREQNSNAVSHCVGSVAR